MAEGNNGIVTTAMVVAAGFSRGNIKYLEDRGLIEKSTRGVYILPEVWDDEMFNLQNRFKRGIYSHETALFLWDLTDRTPNAYSMTFPTNYNLTRPKEENVRCTQCKDVFYDLGIVETNTPGGNEVKVYSIERTLCDILRPQSEVMLRQWENYRKDFEYADGIAFEETCDAVVGLMAEIVDCNKVV